MKVAINLDKNSYNVYINELNTPLDFDNKVVIVSNAKIAGLHLKKLLEKIKCPELFIINIKDGEEYKNFDTLNYILEQMFISKLDRKSTLITFGGGVVSDLGGFAASIYQRGIDFINIPTTFLAMVDAAVGGKTGLNNKFGKNLIGSFYQPKAVYCESDFLKTLDHRQLAAGMAEFIKMALCFDKDSLELIENLDKDKFLNANLSKDIFTKLITKSIELKAKIISLDEKESNIRMLLNYGHTFAHVIENQTNYNQFLHGEAVAIGMNMANQLAYNLDLLTKDDIKRINELLQSFKLNINYKIKDEIKFYDAFSLDKKNISNKINFILLEDIGKAIMKNDIPKQTILNTLKAFK